MAAIGGNAAGPGNYIIILIVWAFMLLFMIQYLNKLTTYVFHGLYLRVVHIPAFESAGDAVVNVYINHEKKFAFVEMRTVEEASNAMALDGIIFEV